ncbi:MAG: homoserine dehydrogenase [Candidatus Ancillula sp.]|nr:homoserine dehydrogenase [Candidatus Ancillula sp.]
MVKKVALVGFGTIGSSVGRIIGVDGANRRESLLRDSNSKSSISDVIADLEITTIVTLEDEATRRLIDTNSEYSSLKNATVTRNFQDIYSNSPDVVVELIGGVHPAYEFIKDALLRGIHVVTANKAVLGEYGEELRLLAAQNNAKLRYEAAVGGAVPVVRAVRNSLMGDKVVSITGVLNGTTNFILDKMTHDGVEYADALKQAQELGFAEADPTADVEGEDAAAKISILASLAFGRDLKTGFVKRTGITGITQGMIIAAKTNGQVYKLIASAVRTGCSDFNDNIKLLVEPQLVPENSAFGELQGSMNAVEIVSEYSGKLTFFGLGAGGNPTASAVLADIVEIASGLDY